MLTNLFNKPHIEDVSTTAADCFHDLTNCLTILSCFSFMDLGDFAVVEGA